MKTLILGLLLAASTVTPAVAQTTSVDQIVSAARGNGTEIEILNARIAICKEIARDFNPQVVDNAISWMRSKGFTEDAINKTQLVCIAYMQGAIDMRNATLNKNTY